MTLPAFPAPRARTTDRDTSHAAAAQVEPKAQTIRDAVLETIQTYAGPGNGFTLVDVVEWYTRRADNGRVPWTTDSSVRTRVSELVRAGLVEDTKSKVTRDGTRGMTLWALVPTGSR